MSSATSELRDTRNTRHESSRPAVPRIGQPVGYHEWDNETRAYVVRHAIVTHVDDPDNPNTTIAATVFTPAAPTGTVAVQRVARGNAPEQWDFLGA